MRRRQEAATAPAGAGSASVLPVHLADGTLELRVSLKDLAPPDTTFYANAASAIKVGDMVTFVLGQVVSLESGAGPQAVVRIDMRMDAVRSLVDSLEGLGERISKIKGDRILSIPPTASPKASVAYLAHAVKVLMNEFMSVLDFYELTPVEGVVGNISPVIRISGFPQLLAFFATEAARFTEERSP